jgi:hypothetical protein
MAEETVNVLAYFRIEGGIFGAEINDCEYRLTSVLFRAFDATEFLDTFIVTDSKGERLSSWIPPHFAHIIRRHDDVKRIASAYYMVFGNFENPDFIQDLYQEYPAIID